MAADRRLYLDNLKVVLIGAIIAIHAVLSYAGNFDVIWYTEVREVTLAPVTEGAMFFVVGPFGLFLIPLLFLVAGLLSRPSLARKGPGVFARDRLLRLGLPFAVYVTLVQPPVVYTLEHSLGVAPGSYAEEFLGKPPQLDMGPLWFVAVLLLFSLGYAAWAAASARHERRRPAPQIRAVHLLLLAVAVAPATFLVRLRFQIGAEGLVAGLNFWEWPACSVLFTLGIVGSSQGWLVAVPDELVRRCRAATFLAGGGLIAFMAAASLAGSVDDQVWRGGANWVAAGFVTFEAALTVFGSVWLLGVAQRHLDRPLRGVGPVARRSAYAAFIVQVVPLIGLAAALRPVPAPAEMKAGVLAIAAVAASFALGWVLVTFVPGLRRVL